MRATDGEVAWRVVTWAMAHPDTRLRCELAFARGERSSSRQVSYRAASASRTLLGIGTEVCSPGSTAT
jgi:hypothetical protein